MTFTSLKDQINAGEPGYCHDCDLTHRDGECPYWRHVTNEGDSAWNEHPDGCYHCGSSHHHSSDCRYVEDEDGERIWGY
jgi:hypothetical protein